MFKCWAKVFPSIIKEGQITFPSHIKLGWYLAQKKLGHFHHPRISYMLKNHTVRGVPPLTEKFSWM